MKTRGKNWTQNEFLRLLHVMIDPKNIVALQQLSRGNATTRGEINAGMLKQSPWQETVEGRNGIKAISPGVFFSAFHDESNEFSIPTAIDPTAYPLVSEKRHSLNPNEFTIHWLLSIVRSKKCIEQFLRIGTRVGKMIQNPSTTIVATI